MILNGENVIQPKKEKHLFCQLFSQKYEKKASAEGFYNQYRNLVIASLKKKGNVIMWQNTSVLTEDEQLSPTFEEVILANALYLIDTRLPDHVGEHYGDLLGSTKSMMDYKADILAKVPVFLVEIENKVAATSFNADQTER
jgi:hypothetical protein